MHALVNHFNHNFRYWLPEFRMQVEGLAPDLICEMNEIFKPLFQIESMSKKWIQLIQNAEYIPDDTESHYRVIWKVI